MQKLLKKPALWISLLAVVGVALFVSNVSKPGAAVQGEFNRAPVPNDENFADLSVLSFNLLHDYPNMEMMKERLVLLAHQLRQNHVDIICLQEVSRTMQLDNTAQFVAEALDLNWAYYRANGNKSLIYFEEGQAILSRFPIVHTAAAVLPPKAGFFENRTALIAQIQTPKGDVAVVSTHLSGNETVQLGQVESLMDFVNSQANGLPVIVGGDFNLEKGGAPYEMLTSAWTDAFYMMHPDLEGHTCCVGNLKAGEGIGHKKRVDYIFSRNGDRIIQLTGAGLAMDAPIDVGSQMLRISDHAGVFARFKL